MTISALAARATAASHSPIVYEPCDRAYAAGFEEMIRRVPDLSRLEALIGSRPSTPLVAIVTEVIAFERAAVASPRRRPAQVDPARQRG